MYRTKIQTDNPYRRDIRPQDVTALKPREPGNSKYDLLWRKKSSKVHKTWEGDAIGLLTRTSAGLLMIVKREGTVIASVKLSPESSICEGKVFASGGFEFEIGATHTRNAETEPGKENSFGEPVFKRRRDRLGHSDSTLTSKPTYTVGTANASSASPVLRKSPQKLTLGLLSPFKSPLTTPNCLDSCSIISGDIHPILKTKLRTHQVQGAQFMRDCVLGIKHGHGYGCILADDMGLGKTLTAIALIHTLLHHKNIQNALIACPVSLIANWKDEFSKWLPNNEHIRPLLGIMTIDQNGLGNGSLKDPVRSFFSDRNFRTHQVMIVGYERMRLLSARMATEGKTFDLVICDEGHRLKSPGSKTTLAISEISGEKRVILTGTPIQNELSEFRALADFVNPGCLGSEAQFDRKFAGPIRDFATVRQADIPAFEEEGGNLEDVVGFLSSQNGNNENHGTEAAQEALSQLSEICDEFMLRRTSSMIETYLEVPRTEVVVFCCPTKPQAAKYKSLVDQADDLVKVDQLVNQGACLRALSELKKAAAGDAECQGGKMKFLAYLLDAIKSQTDDEKVVVASGSTRVLDLCQQLCANKNLPWLRLDGSTPQEKRQSSVSIFNKFSRKQAFVFLLSTRSGGTGLNLIGASRLVLMDCDWNPAVDAQVMARIYRDGQLKACFIYRLLTTGTIDEKIFQRQLSKTCISENVLLGFAGVSKAEFSLDTLRDLFTFSSPAKCNTLDETTQKNGGLKLYEEENDSCMSDRCLKVAYSEANNVSCILRRKSEQAPS